jgi:hypothetical protein
MINRTVVKRVFNAANSSNHLFNRAFSKGTANIIENGESTVDFWIKPVIASDAKSMSYHVGITEHFITSRIFGDIDSIAYMKSRSPVPSVFQIQWSGMKVGEGDELYHSVWSNEEGELVMDVHEMLPKDLKQSYTVLEVNESIIADVSHFNEDKWLFRVCFPE